MTPVVVLFLLPILCCGRTSTNDFDPPQAVWVQVRGGNNPPFTVAPAANDIDHLKKAIKAEVAAKHPTLIAPDITVYAPDPDGDVEAVLPSGAKAKFAKVTKQSTPLEANTEDTPYLFELPAAAAGQPTGWVPWVVTALVVVVPLALWKYQQELAKLKADQQLASSQRLKWDSVLYKSIAEAASKPIATEGNFSHFRVLEKAEPWPGTLDNRILVRQWHVDFWARFGSSMSASKVCILGTPGIGKSVGLNYILHSYLAAAATGAKGCQKRYVALILPNSRLLYLFDTCNKVSCQVHYRDDGDANGVLIPFYDNLLVLHDLAKDAPMTPRSIPTVLATSPKYEKYNEFMKGLGHHFYVPLFSDDEMEALSQYFFPGVAFNEIDGGWKTWRDAAQLFGNVPRQVFGATKDELVATWAQFQSLVENTTVEKFMGCKQQALQGMNDRLVWFIPTKEYGYGGIKFREGSIMRCLAEEMVKKKLNEWHKIVTYAQNGTMFENVLHEFLATFPSQLTVDKIRPLLKDKAHPSEAEQSQATTKLQKLFPTKSWEAVQFCDSTKVELQTLHYYYPRKPNFAVIDSFVFCRKGSSKGADLLCFQMTIAEEHRTTATKLEKFVENFNKCFSYNGSPAEIVVGAKGKPQLQAGEKLDLGIHLIYVSQGDLFDYQTLAPEAHVVNKFENLWSYVLQYHSGPPRVD